MRMTKYRVVCLFVTVAAGVCLATAQSSKAGSTSAKPGKDPLHAATKPLTPKSAIPAPHKSSSSPTAPKSASKTTAELNHLERRNIKARDKTSAPPAKVAALPKATDQSAENGSGTNFKYQKPTGGLKAQTPKPNSPNSSTPRVTKSN
jgi:hypothetical protein